jgi:hypothetical protein
MVSGRIDLSFTLQYRKTLPILYTLNQMVRWTLGPTLTLSAIGGGWIALRKLAKDGDGAVLMLLLWVGTIFCIGSLAVVKFPRYMLPAYPALIILSCGMFKPVERYAWRLQTSIGLIIAVPTLFLGFAYFNMLSAQHPWIAASRYIYSKYPDGTVIAVEDGDDALPLNLDRDQSPLIRDNHFETVSLSPFVEPDDCAKAEVIAETLSRADLLVIASDRAYGVIPRFSERFPLMRRYYLLLFSESLGFKMKSLFQRSPNVFGIDLGNTSFQRASLPSPGLPPAISLGFIDESLTVYDHPQVFIFENQSRFGPEQIRKMICEDYR